MRIHVEARSETTPERVFALYADAARVPEWRPSIRAIDADGPVELPGTTFTTRYRGMRPPTRGRVVRSEPPRLHVLAGGGLVHYEATLRLEPIAAGTQIAFALEAGLPRLLQGRIEREIRAEIERLARLAERSP